jgi:hypothetical protein
MSDNDLLHQLREASRKPEFHLWNSVSVQGFKYIMGDETNSEEVRSIAEELLHEYNNWLINKDIGYNWGFLSFLRFF